MDGTRLTLRYRIRASREDGINRDLCSCGEYVLEEES